MEEVEKILKKMEEMIGEFIYIFLFHTMEEVEKILKKMEEMIGERPEPQYFMSKLLPATEAGGGAQVRV